MITPINKILINPHKHNTSQFLYTSYQNQLSKVYDKLINSCIV
jgi:hypothetical protein